MHLAINFLLILVFIAFGWIFFAIWLVATVFSRLFNFARRALGLTSAPREQAAARRCPRLRCRTENPGAANYCRRCGARIVRNIVLDVAIPDRTKPWTLPKKSKETRFSQIL
jgi:hypothetical protein